MASCFVGASYFKRPGRKNDAGEMLCEARMPPQPAPKATTAAKAAARIHFQSHFTAGTIEAMRGLATLFSKTFLIMRFSTTRAAVGCTLMMLAGAVTAAETGFAARAERAYLESEAFGVAADHHD